MGSGRGKNRNLSQLEQTPIRTTTSNKQFITRQHSQTEMAMDSSIPAWEIPWTEEPGGLQSIGSQRIRHDWATEQQQSTH